MKKTNYHTHTTFCDGKNSAEEMVKAAIEKNFNILGFSSHSMFPFSSDWHIGSHDFEKYAAEINRLREMYKDKIEILLGFEADYIAGVTCPDAEIYKAFNPDYLIGSVHFVPGKKGFIEADGSASEVLAGIRNYFDGDEKKAVCEYFALEREMLAKGKFDIIGHPDLIKKQNNKRTLFDENSSWYKKELKATADAISKAGVIVELNTGAIARSGMTEPYPSPYFLQLLKERNVPVTVNSDAHYDTMLDCWFDESIPYLRNSGYSEVACLTKDGVKFQKL